MSDGGKRNVNFVTTEEVLQCQDQAAWGLLQPKQTNWYWWHCMRRELFSKTGSTLACDIITPPATQSYRYQVLFKQLPESRFKKMFPWVESALVLYRWGRIGIVDYRARLHSDLCQNVRSLIRLLWMYIFGSTISTKWPTCSHFSLWETSLLSQNYYEHKWKKTSLNCSVL